MKAHNTFFSCRAVGRASRVLLLGNQQLFSLAFFARPRQRPDNEHTIYTAVGTTNPAIVQLPADRNKLIAAQIITTVAHNSAFT